MSEHQLQHWTEDEDLLSEYVLGRVSKVDLAGLQRHLRTCPRCQAAVQHERMLASGIRQHARDNLKSRLGKKIAGQALVGQRILTWQRAFSAVAVLVIAVGVGIYNGWFFVGDRAVSPPKLQQQPAEQEEAVLRGDSSQQLKENVVHVSPPSEVNRVEGNRKRENLASERTLADRNLQESRLEDKRLMKAAQSAENVSATSGAGGGAISAKKESEGIERKTSSQFAQQTIWIEGAFVSPSQSQAVNEQSGKKFLMESAPAVQQKNKVDQAASADQKQSGNQHEGYELEQRKANMASRPKQGTEQGGSTPIQTLVAQTNRVLSFTIYLDTLFNSEDFRDARVTRIGPDSMVIEVGPKQIGYRFPRGFLESVKNAKKTRGE